MVHRISSWHSAGSFDGGRMDGTMADDILDPSLAGLDRIILQFRAIKLDLAEIERIWNRDPRMARDNRDGPDCRHVDRC